MLAVRGACLAVRVNDERYRDSGSQEDVILGIEFSRL
jgi:hypothetical protein